MLHIYIKYVSFKATKICFLMLRTILQFEICVCNCLRQNFKNLKHVKKKTKKNFIDFIKLHISRLLFLAIY